MRFFAIGDLHLDSKKEKPMDIFGENWIEHEEKIIRNWQESVSDDDLVLLPGDISWAIKLEDAIKDLKIIDNLPGKKVLIRGNHDYWWATKRKLSNLDLKSIEFLVNDIYVSDKLVVSGVRGWNEETSSQIEDKRIFDRELRRLEMSLRLTKNYNLYKIVMLHFPPFNSDKRPNDFVALMKEYNVNKCVYGHLHGNDGHKLAIEGNVEGIDFLCVSSDYLDFKLKEILI
jgi:predicted phosphohydrolase